MFNDDLGNYISKNKGVLEEIKGVERECKILGPDSTVIELNGNFAFNESRIRPLSCMDITLTRVKKTYGFFKFLMAI